MLETLDIATPDIEMPDIEMPDFEMLATTATLEACVEFRPGHDDLLVCSCGWLEDDHTVAVLAAIRHVRPRRPRITVPERQAS